MHTYALLGFVHILVHDVNQVVFDLCLCILDFLFSGSFQQLRSSNGLFEARSRNLDTHCTFDFLVVDVLGFDSHLLEWVWGKQSSDLRDNSSVETLEHNGVLHFEHSVDQHHVNCCSETLNDLDLKHCALEFISFFKLLRDAHLAHLAQIGHQVWKTFSSNCRCWNQTIILFHVIVLPVQTGVQTLFCKCNDCLLNSSFEFLNRVLGLHREGVLEVVILLGFPLVDSVDLVQSDDERTFLLLKEFDGLESLLFEAMHQIDYQDSDITERRSSASEVGERFVTWGIDDQEAWQVIWNIYLVSHLLHVAIDVLFREVGCTDLLSDTSSFTCLHICLSQFI